MKKFYLFLIILLFLSVPAFAQKPKPIRKRPLAAAPTPTAADEKAEFEKAEAQTDLTEKIAALQKFAADFPNSSERVHALELVVSARAQLADEKLRAGDAAAAVELFKQAVADAPAPVSDKLFSEVVLQFPTNLFYGGQSQAAIEIARAIEEKVGANAKQILGLATFYIGTENAAEARRLAEKAIALDPKLPVAYQTLGLADRLGFQLDEAVAAYTKALELDSDSVVSKRSLAEMKRAVGKPDEAAALYREILGKNADAAAAQTGLTLALFDSGKQTEAEAEMAKTLEKNPNDLFLLTSATYWYAARGMGAKAVDLAQKAVAVEPRYTWAHIALARGFLSQNRYGDAEKSLLRARQYGNFPTLNYELAAVRLAAGFYEEAARELRKSFTVTDDLIQTKLGNRVPQDGKSFIELLAPERSASIFEPLSADNPETAAKLKALLTLSQKLASADATDAEIEQAVNDFVKADDKTKTNRQLYAANRLLQAKRDLPKVLELTQGAVAGVDSALDAPNASSAILADELFESRTIAISRGEIIVVPSIPRQTLSAILRGRIEEISGWTFFNQNKPQEAVVHLKRAVSVLPEKSAWWRSSMWRLGAAFDAAGSPALALDAYVKSYLSAPPDLIKYSVIETVYQKVNGSLDGLDKKIGAKPADAIAAAVIPETGSALNTEAAKTEPSPAPTTTPTPEATPETSPMPENSPTPKAEPAVKPRPKVSATPQTETAPQPTPTPRMTKTTAAIKPPETIAKTSPASLFDPVIITIPKRETAKPPKSDAEKAQPDNPDSKASEKPKDSTAVDDSGEARARVSNAQNAVNADCRINVNQENVTLVANGGKLGVLVGFEGDGDISKIVASSSNPADINIALDPDIGKQSNQAFFVIKSVSAKTGIFTVTFESACGKKEIQVKVR
ncbi:MAG: tetratricopeptide repeat protein [Pyrinomonadaceae bacterium]